MEERLMFSLRAELKSKLYRERKRLSKAGYQPVCGICSRPPRAGALQMHEAFLSREDVRGNDELKYDIMSKYNCVLLHSECHEFANTEEGKIACAKHLLYHEGYEKIDSWLACVEARMNTTTATEARNLIKLIHEGEIK